ncbi:MAG TPA: energy-coupling factor ABC transporter permease [Pararobbsia sp.]|nr:energy-coupling factor ABC transporter permease [Pararobbsia sp.]
MGFIYATLPLAWIVGGWLAAAGLLAYAVWTRPLRKLRHDTQQHLWLATVVTLSVLWAIDEWFGDGPTFHLLGAALMVTLFDWALALIGTYVMIGLSALMLDAPPDTLGLTLLALGAVPVLVALALQRLLSASLPRHRAVFVLGHGFVAPALSLIAAALAGVLLHAALAGEWQGFPVDFWNQVLWVAGGEAWFSGTLTAILAIYKPAWVTTYDDHRYHLDQR